MGDVQLQDLLPDADLLIRLEPEELAGALLQVVASRHNPGLHPSSFEGNLFGHQQKYPQHLRPQIIQAINEAWVWLEAQVLIVPADADMNGRNGWRIASRRGKRLANATSWDSYRKASMLPKALLHQRIADVIFFDFARGDYSSAILKAFKEVEVSVRDSAGLTDGDFGTKLMSKAFHPEEGPLTDPHQEAGERQALMQLFVGAIGSYKNPHSHRKPDLDDPAEVVEMIMLASHLLRIVDARRPPQ